jgi:hypothetical protein
VPPLKVTLNNAEVEWFVKFAGAVTAIVAREKLENMTMAVRSDKTRKLDWYFIFFILSLFAT